jgi:hypothetical protein
MQVRLEQPIAAMREAGAQVYWYEKKIGVPPSVDVVVIQRMIADQSQWDQLAREIEDRGALLVTEWDDHPEKFPEAIRARFGPQPLIHVLSGHAVQTSTPILQKLFKVQHPEVAFFPNQLKTLPPIVKKSIAAPRLFFGALNRECDWVELMPAINHALDAYPMLRAVVLHDQAFFDQLRTSNKEFHRAQPYERYLQLMQGCDLVLMPLADRIENHCKSDIKFVEAAAGAATVIASPVVYDQTIHHQHTGWIANTPQSWYDAIDYLLNHPEERLAIGHAARAYVAGKRMLAMHVHDRLHWYRSLIERRDCLIEARRERVNRRLKALDLRG